MIQILQTKDDLTTKGLLILSHTSGPTPLACLEECVRTFGLARQELSASAQAMIRN